MSGAARIRVAGLCRAVGSCLCDPQRGQLGKQGGLGRLLGKGGGPHRQARRGHRDSLRPAVHGSRALGADASEQDTETQIRTRAIGQRPRTRSREKQGPLSEAREEASVGPRGDGGHRTARHLLGRRGRPKHLRTTPPGGSCAEKAGPEVSAPPRTPLLQGDAHYS